jgi:hypothetical protein
MKVTLTVIGLGLLTLAALISSCGGGESVNLSVTAVDPMDSSAQYCKYEVRQRDPDLPPNNGWNVGDILCLKCCPAWNNRCPKKVTLTTADGYEYTLKIFQGWVSCNTCPDAAGYYNNVCK